MSLAVVCSANLKGKFCHGEEMQSEDRLEEAVEGYQTLDFPPDHGLFVLLCRKPLIHPVYQLLFKFSCEYPQINWDNGGVL